MKQIGQSGMQSTIGELFERDADREMHVAVYSSWRKRALAHQIDQTVILPFAAAGLILLLKGANHFVNPWYLFLAIVLIGFGGMISFYNRCIMMGTTGQSWGKKVVGIRLVSVTTEAPIGVGNAIVREMAHAVDIVPIGFGLILPVADRKRQTLADKITNAVVIDVPSHIRFDKLDGAAG